MSNPLKRFLCTAAVVVLAGSAWGFSLQGPPGAWMTPRLGYIDLLPGSSFSYGPMIIGEEYRMNVPTMYYGFTPSFMNYFGNHGAAQIDEAFKVLNDLPDSSKLKLESYPLSSMRLNHRAFALGLQDIKSVVLGMALEQMGLADPTRYVYTLRNRWTTPATTNYFIIRRNYDPQTWLTSSYINGVLWTYPFVTDIDNTHSWVYTEPVDPLAYLGYLSSPVVSWQSFLVTGGFYTRLTRDDVGGLYYLYRPDNYNIEQLGTSVTGLAGGGGPWGPPPGGTGTNTVGTNTLGTNVLVNAALRGSRTKITFKRVDFDGMLGFFKPFTNSYTDTYITNGFKATQYLERPLVSPDILFDVADLQGGDAGNAVVFGSFGTQAWLLGNTATNVTGGAGLNLGPGSITGGSGGPAFSFTFNNVVDIFWNTFPLDNQDELTASRTFIWGSFDGTTNAPVVYPIGTDVRDVERFVMERDNSLVWGSP